MNDQIDFQPILLGTDFNCYGMARSFYEAYGIKSIAYGVTHMAPTRYTKLADVHVIEGFNEDPGFIKSMREIAKNLKPDKKYLLLWGWLHGTDRQALRRAEAMVCLPIC